MTQQTGLAGPAIATIPTAQTQLAPTDNLGRGTAATIILKSPAVTQQTGLVGPAIATIPTAQTELAPTDNLGRGTAATIILKSPAVTQQTGLAGPAIAATPTAQTELAPIDNLGRGTAAKITLNSTAGTQQTGLVGPAIAATPTAQTELTPIDNLGRGTVANTTLNRTVVTPQTDLVGPAIATTPTAQTALTPIDNLGRGTAAKTTLNSTAVTQGTGLVGPAIAATPTAQTELAPIDDLGRGTVANTNLYSTALTQGTDLVGPAIAAAPTAQTELIPIDNLGRGTVAKTTLNSTAAKQETNLAGPVDAAASTSTALTPTAKKGRQSAATGSTSKAAVGIWWWLLPLLLLPLLGFFLWSLFREWGSREKEQTEAQQTTVTQHSQAENRTGGLGATSDREVFANDKTACSIDPGTSTEHGPDIVSPTTAVTGGKTELDLKTVDTDARTTSSVKFASDRKAKTVESPKERESNTVIFETDSDLAEVSSSTSDSGSTTSSDDVLTKTANAATAAQTGLAFTTSVDETPKPQNEDLNSSTKSARPFRYRDALTRIDGINAETQQAFFNAGYYHYSDIQNANIYDLEQVFADDDSQFTPADFKAWLKQAKSLSSEQNDKQHDFQPDKRTTLETERKNDLTKINGVGPATAELLRKSGITTFESLHEADLDHLQSILSDGGAKFAQVNPSTWSAQARFATTGQIKSSKKITRDTVTEENAAFANGSQTSSNRSTFTTTTPQVSVTSGTPDDLTKIDGVGPATAKLLRASGIKTFRSLHEADTDHLQSILSNGGTQFKLVDPSSWTEQTRFAMNDDWSGLTNWKTTQDVAAGESIAQANENAAAKTVKSQQSTVAKLDPLTADDLTKIHGLGKASQKVLNESNINSFVQVASMTSEQLDAIFAKKHKRFQLINTSTWPTQAEQFASEASGQEVSSLNFEMELLDEIDSIRSNAASSMTSSSTPGKKKKTSKRD